MENTRRNAGSLTGEATKIGERSEEVLVAGQKNGREALEKFQDRGKEALQDTQKLIQKHPGKAMGLAVLVGAVFGALVTLSRNKA